MVTLPTCPYIIEGLAFRAANSFLFFLSFFLAVLERRYVLVGQNENAVLLSPRCDFKRIVHSRCGIYRYINYCYIQCNNVISLV